MGETLGRIQPRRDLALDCGPTGADHPHGDPAGVSPDLGGPSSRAGKLHRTPISLLPPLYTHSPPPPIYSAPSSQSNFLKTSIESLTHTQIKNLRGPLNLISVLPTSIPDSSYASHAGLVSCSHPRTFAYAVLSWALSWLTSRRPSGHPIPNTLTLHLLAVCLGPDGQCNI